MREPDLPLEGGCRCGAVRLRVSAPPMITAACHCRGCQRMTGSAFSTTVIVPSDGFAVIAGEPVIGGLGDGAIRHHHCDRCKSWLFTRVVPEMGFVNVRATMLDDATWFAPFMETQTAEKLPWAETGAPRSFDRFADMGDYAGLMAEYRAALA